MLCERGFTVDCVMLDGASTNRTFTGMLFHGPPADSAWMFHDIFDRHHQICAIQDIMHCIKKLRNNIESSKSEHKQPQEGFLFLMKIQFYGITGRVVSTSTAKAGLGYITASLKNIWRLLLHPK